MIVVAVLAIIAAIALPSYLAQVRKSRRSSMEGMLQQVALLQEQFRADCTTYATGFGYACPTLSTLTFPASSAFASNYYGAITFPTATATAYSLSVTATSTGSQNNDRANGVDCSTLTYAYSAGAVTKGPSDCWAKQ